MILSFYLDDTNPNNASPKAYETFLNYCISHDIEGESSVILGYGGKSITINPNEEELEYIELAKKSYTHGIDTHMEIMTHHELFDFELGQQHEEGIHEGLWLHEPAVTVDEYQDYFDHILAEGEKYGIKYTGLTWPGCGCDACSAQYAELRKSGPLKFNPAVWQALMNLVKEGRFRSRVIPIFYESSETNYDIIQKATEGEYAIYDLMPNAKDHFGIWENASEHVDPDYYITADGKSGIIIRHLQEGAPYCMWYMHWQGLNPENGVGWEAFKTVTERIEEFLSDQVVWMRPSDIATHYHDAGSWDFVEDI